MRSEIVKLHRKINATTIYVTHDQTEAMTMADRIVVMKHGYVQQIGTPSEIYNYPNNKFVAQFIGSPVTNVIKVLYDKDGTIHLDDNKKLKLSERFVKAHDEYYENYNYNYEDEISRLEDEIKKINSLKKLNEREQKILDTKINKLNELCNNLLNLKRALSGESHYIYFGFRPEHLHHFVDANRKYNKSDDFDFEITLSELLGNDYYLYFNIGEKEVIGVVPATDKLIKPNDVISFHFDLDKVHIYDMLSENRIL